MTSRLLVLREKHKVVRGQLNSALRVGNREEATVLAHDYLRPVEQIILEQDKAVAA